MGIESLTEASDEGWIGHRAYSGNGGEHDNDLLFSDESDNLFYAICNLRSVYILHIQDTLVKSYQTSEIEDDENIY